MSHIWTTLVRGDRDFEQDIDKRSVAAARRHLDGPYSLWRRWGNVINVNKPYYTERRDGIVGRPEEIAEGVQEVPLAVPVPIADMKLRVKLLGLGLLLSKERVDDEGPSGLIQKLVPKIMERQAEALEIAFQQMLLVNPTTYDPLRDQLDGVSLFNTAHPAGTSGATWSNTVASGSALTEQTLADAINSFFSYVDDNGDYAPLMPTRFELGVHPTKMQQARQIVQSSATLTLQQNSGVKNLSTVGGITYDVVPLLYSTNPTAWVLRALDGTDEGGLTVVMRQAPSAPKKIIRENPDQVQYYSKARWGMGSLNGGRGLFYNPGA